MNTSQSQSGLPASRTSTWLAGSSESRLARTLPADPPPTMMKSNRRAMAIRGSAGSGADQHRLQLGQGVDRIAATDPPDSAVRPAAAAPRQVRLPVVGRLVDVDEAHVDRFLK